MEYELIKSKRRTMSITVRDGKVQVRAPRYINKKNIDIFVKSKESWIIKHVKRQLDEKVAQDNFVLSHKSKILYLGEEIEIPLDIKNIASTHDLKSQIKKYYKAQAKEIITSKVGSYSRIMGLEPSNIKITSAKTRWGSCSAKGNVNFSWFLIMAPEEQIDYVVVHELAHMKEMNHSKYFWAIVEKYVPDWKAKRKELKVLHRRLNTENWD